MSQKKTTAGTVSRRTFLETSALLTGAAGLNLAGIPFAKAAQPLNVKAAGETVSWSACVVNCAGRCALRAISKDGAVIRIETDNTGNDVYGDHQARACLRGRSMRKRTYSAERLKYPMKRVGKRGEGKFVRISWDEALDTIANELKRIISRYGNEAIFPLYGSGNQQLASGRTAYRRFFNLIGGYLVYYGDYSTGQITRAAPFTYGNQTSGSYLSEINNSKLVVMFGNNTCVTRMSGGGLTYDLSREMSQEDRPRLVLIDPFYTDTGLGKEDEWVPIRPGTDAALIEGMAYVMITEHLVNQAFLDQYCVGYDEKTLPADAPANGHYKAHILGHGPDGIAKTPAWAAKITGVPEATIVRLAREIATTGPCYIAQGWGPQRQANGEQTSRAIMMLPLLTGNIGLPGTSSGAREGDSGISTVAFPTGTNPIKTAISHFMWTDAIWRGTEMTALADGVQGKAKLDVPIKFLWVQASNTLINQHSDTNLTHKILQNENDCECIVVIENQMTPSARYADILLPDTSPLEDWGLISDGPSSINYLISMQPAHAPMFETRSTYEMCRELAKRFGVEDKFTEGKTHEQWVAQIYEQTRVKYPDQLPDYESFKKQGIVRVKISQANSVALRGFRNDPVANPLTTPSGKIEIYSSRLAEIARTWILPEGDVISALPKYVVTWESHLDPLTKAYPLQMVSFHTKGRTHSTYHNIDWLREVAPDEVWINPVDAQKYSIRHRDIVYVFNDRGTIVLPAKITPRIMPGVVGVPQGAWYKPGADGIDEGCCVNTLTNLRPSPLAKSNPQHTNLVEIRKV